MSKMRALIAAFCFAASLLAIASGVECPIGELVNGELVNASSTHDICSSCVEYQCGQKNVQLGCYAKALKECPAFAEVPYGKKDVIGYCSKNADNKTSFYFPGCMDDYDYDACRRTRAFAATFLTFKNACKEELGHGRDSFKKTLDFSPPSPAIPITCPMGERINGVVFPARRPQKCSSCVEYQCGQKNMQLGCPEHAIKDCPALEEKVSIDRDLAAYCQKEANGTITLFYLPGCKGFPDPENCAASKEYQVAVNDFQMRCQELEEAEALLKYNNLSQVLCPFRRSLNFNDSGRETFCEACAAYQCDLSDQDVSGMGCVRDFFFNCLPFEHERAQIASYSPDKMIYCNDNVFYLSGCEKEKNASEYCDVGGVNYKDAIMLEVANCAAREPAQMIYGPPRDEL